MAENYVEILVKSRDDAKADLDELRAKLDELKSTVATARAEVDDKDAAASLDRMQAKLLDLDHKTANPKIRMSGAIRAEAEIHALEASLDKLKRKEDEVLVKAGTQGLISRILNGAMGSGGNAIPGGGLAGSLFGPAGLAIVPAVMALVPEIVALASGFAAAGAGAASFGLLAMPAIKQVETAYTSLSTAQAAYKAAQAKAAADPTKANETAVKTAALNLKLAQDAVKKMPGSEQGAISGIHRLASEFGNMSKAFAPEVFKVFNDGLKIAGRLLPDVLPFAKTFADVLDGLLKKVANFTDSKGFKDWLKQFHSLEGPALKSIGDGIGKVVIAIGKLLTLFSGKDVANAINIFFDIIATSIDVVRSGVHRLMENWDGMSSTARRDSHQVAVAFDNMRHDIAKIFDAVRHNVADLGHYWAGQFDRMRHDIADFGHNVATWFDRIRHDIAHWADDVVTLFRQLPGRILAAMSRLPGEMKQLGIAVVTGFIHGIESMLGAIASAAGSMVSHLGHTVLHLLGISSPSRVAHWWGEMIGQGLAEGIDAGAGRAVSAAARMAGGVSAGFGGGLRGLPAGAGGGAPVVQIQPVPGGSGLDQLFMTWLKNSVRAQGGDPAVFTRKVAFQ